MCCDGRSSYRAAKRIVTEKYIEGWPEQSRECLFAAAPGYAQPSGGPYGPIEQRYEIPKAALRLLRRPRRRNHAFVTAASSLFFSSRVRRGTPIDQRYEITRYGLVPDGVGLRCYVSNLIEGGSAD